MDEFEAFKLVGRSPAFLDVIELIRRFAACDATVLVQGETGTGKELVARAIHYQGARRTFPFIPVNCGALPDTLVENELFGHVRGAFTDARDAQGGLIAEAQGGTLFLDEVEALTPKVQVTLLRFLQNFEYRPVGGAPVRNANVRIIAASNADLHALQRGQHFRQDLLFRLNVLTIDLPPLRERRNDVVLLAEIFLKRLAEQYRRPHKRLHEEAVERLMHYRWPGNVRELENLMHREFLMSDADVIHLRSLPAPLVCNQGATAGAPMTACRFQDAKASAIARFERDYICELLSRTGGNISQAARISGKERSRIVKLVKKYGLERMAFARDAEAGL